MFGNFHIHTYTYIHMIHTYIHTYIHTSWKCYLYMYMGVRRFPAFSSSFPISFRFRLPIELRVESFTGMSLSMDHRNCVELDLHVLIWFSCFFGLLSCPVMCMHVCVFTTLIFPTSFFLFLFLCLTYPYFLSTNMWHKPFALFLKILIWILIP